MAIKVKTRDWGDKFKDVSAHVGDKGAANNQHLNDLKLEITSHSGHAFSRHGHQAGWIEQLVRVVTNITPDQSFSPYGVEASIREWNHRWMMTDSGFESVCDTYDASGETVLGKSGSAAAPTSHVTAAGDDSGGFLSPELQQEALGKALAVLPGLSPIIDVEFPGIKKAWKPMDRVMIVVKANGTGFGMGYRRLPSFVPRTRDEVLELVEAVEKGKTREQLGWTSSNVLVGTPHGVIMRPEKARPAFTGPGDLLDYLGVEAVWQKTALVIFKRDGAGWSRVTMFPCNYTVTRPVEWAPATKVPGKPWSGQVHVPNPPGAPALRTYPVPAWTPQ